MKVHFIAIGGSAMHNLAIALHDKGIEVKGSDDEIRDPSKSRLASRGLLPEHEGWDASKISTDLDAVILGMHARKDNPELLKAQELKIPIYSYPEYLYESTKGKTRVVIGGSHGKTTITSMILHCLKSAEMEHDFMVGAQLEGFDCMVRLSETADIAILEGDEYLSSPIDLRSKFHLYHPNIALLSGIAWDHINVFPTFEEYVEQFKIFVDLIEPNGTLIYYQGDDEVRKIAENARKDIKTIPYGAHPYRIYDGVSYLQTSNVELPIMVFGQHNMENLNGAMAVCLALGMSSEQFYKGISSFSGASKRMEKIAEAPGFNLYRDFAHSPSKLRATLKALAEQEPDKTLVACMELHTFSSLNKGFLKEYGGTMDAASIAVVFYSPETLSHKQLPDISIEEVKESFGREDLIVFTETKELEEFLSARSWENSNLLLMSSGNFRGLELVGKIPGLGETKIA